MVDEDEKLNKVQITKKKKKKDKMLMMWCKKKFEKFIAKLPFYIYYRQMCINIVFGF